MRLALRSISRLALLLLIAGCSSAANDAARPTPDTQPLPNVPSESYFADIDSLANRIIPLTLNELHWASLHTDNQITALRITAITPADQPIEIRAQYLGNNQSAVQIRAGYFGDNNLERAFHKALNEVVSRWNTRQKQP